ncbi:conjugal transfer protein [Escherichia coli]|nr:conjugal transfer protein [Escherichia coli]
MIRKLCIAASLSITLCSLSYAGGVPTVSIAELTQMVKNAQQQANEALAQLNKAKEAIQQAKDQYEHYKGLLQGNDKLGSFLNDPYINKLLPMKDWDDIYNKTKDLTDLRKRYGIAGYEPDVQKLFDKLLTQVDVYEKQYNGTVTRVRHAEELRNKLNSVQTPKEREQLALRYQQEMLELETQKVQLENTRYLMEQKERLENKKKEEDFNNFMWGRKSS